MKRDHDGQPSGPSHRVERLLFRFGPSAVALAVFAAMVGLYRQDGHALYFRLLEWWGVPAMPHPLADTGAVLRAISCWRDGVDVFVPNACMGGGWYSYSPLLLKAAALPVGVDDVLPIGILLDVAFLASFCALPVPRSWKELAVRTVAVLSTATAFAVERANLDIAMFLLVVAGARLVSREGRAGLKGYGLLFVAALIKFYPAASLLVMARERPRKAAALGLATLVLAGAFLLHAAQDSARAVQLAPAGSPVRDMFGARNLPLALGMVFSPPDGMTEQELVRAPIPPAGKAILALLVLAGCWVGSKSFRLDRASWGALSAAQESFLVAGAATVALCFFAAQNVAYRGVFLLMVLPGLFALEAGAPSEAERRRFVPLVAAVVFLVWEEFFHHLEASLQPLLAAVLAPDGIEFLFWTARELTWWWVIARLGALLAIFVLGSPSAREVTEFVTARLSRRPH